MSISTLVHTGTKMMQKAVPFISGLADALCYCGAFCKIEPCYACGEEVRKCPLCVLLCSCGEVYCLDKCYLARTCCPVLLSKSEPLEPSPYPPPTRYLWKRKESANPCLPESLEESGRGHQPRHPSSKVPKKKAKNPKQLLKPGAHQCLEIIDDHQPLELIENPKKTKEEMKSFPSDEFLQDQLWLFIQMYRPSQPRKYFELEGDIFHIEIRETTRTLPNTKQDKINELTCFDLIKIHTLEEIHQRKGYSKSLLVFLFQVLPRYYSLFYIECVHHDPWWAYLRQLPGILSNHEDRCILFDLTKCKQECLL